MSSELNLKQITEINQSQLTTFEKGNAPGRGVATIESGGS